MPFTHYLFVYFTGNSRADEAMRFVISADGLLYRAVKLQTGESKKLFGLNRPGGGE